MEKPFLPNSEQLNTMKKLTCEPTENCSQIDFKNRQSKYRSKNKMNSKAIREVQVIIMKVNN